MRDNAVAAWAADQQEQRRAKTCNGRGSRALAVCEQIKMTDANQTAGRDMGRESAEELMCRNGHDLLLAAMHVTAPEEFGTGLGGSNSQRTAPCSWMRSEICSLR